MSARPTISIGVPVYNGENFLEDALRSLQGQTFEDFELVIQHDTDLQSWQCGGPLVDLSGKAVGLNIARAGRVASYALPAELVERIIHTLLVHAGDTP